MICPVCRKRVKPIKFTLWPPIVLNLCPICRIAVGEYKHYHKPKPKKEKKHE
jgi:hypothetical protein